MCCVRLDDLDNRHERVDNEVFLKKNSPLNHNPHSTNVYRDRKSPLDKHHSRPELRGWYSIEDKLSCTLVHWYFAKRSRKYL